MYFNKKKILFILHFILASSPILYSQTLVKDISIGSESSFNEFSEEIFGVLNDVAVFSIISEDDSIQIWRSDGTEDGTYSLHSQSLSDVKIPSILLDDIILIGLNQDTSSSLLRIDNNAMTISEVIEIDGVITDFNLLNGAVYFKKGDDNNFFRELVKFDIDDNSISIINNFGFSGIRDLVTHNNELSLIAVKNDTTFLLSYNDLNNTFSCIKNLHVGLDFSKSNFMTSTNEYLYFFHSFDNIPYTLWSSDGSETGTQILYDSLNIGNQNNEVILSKLKTVSGFNNKLFFNGRNLDEPFTLDFKLFTTVENNTAPFIFQDQNIALPSFFTRYGDDLYFRAGYPDFISNNIFKYNLDSEEIELALDSEAINGTSILGGNYLTVFQEKLFFAGFIEDNSMNTVLYSSQGSTASTSSINPNLEPQALNPIHLSAGENKLFFFAETEEFGNELWVYNPDSTVSVLEQLIPDHFKIYPNPAHDIIHIETEDPSTYQIEIYNSLGKKVISSSASGKHYQLNLTNLPAGIYYLNLQADNSSEIKKIIKTNIE